MNRAPLVVAYGGGTDSTAMLIGMQQRGEVPDLILMADTGDEKPNTIAFLPVMNQWLAKVGFPQITIVKNPRPKTGDKSLSDSLLRLGTLPALAYRQHQCTLVWKVDPQQKFVKTWAPAIAARAAGLDVIQCIGYDAGKQDGKRCNKAMGKKFAGYTNRYPLIEWGWDRARCIAEIEKAGLPQPGKSSCFHCPASKREEIEQLRDESPEQFARALEIERRAIAKGLKTIKGLGIRFTWAAIAIQPV